MANIYNVFNESENINVYNEGVKTVYSTGEREFNDILECWNKMIEGAHDMPAFGVSIDKYTKEELKKGLWVEFDFGKVLSSNGMPFEKLLINVNKSFYGFNLIRYTASHGYDGRCFYFDLVGKNMADFYDLLLKM